MESRPQNPESRNNPKSLLLVDWHFYFHNWKEIHSLIIFHSILMKFSLLDVFL